ncbi:hypothetical protein GX48_07620 [Paracoccidioides brasiliensis]|nr:hypothetical protein GX48_07620 [Paracoccidioides brasiliensis]
MAAVSYDLVQDTDPNDNRATEKQHESSVARQLLPTPIVPSEELGNASSVSSMKPPLDNVPQPKDQPSGYKLRRFWLRTLIGVVVPPAVTGYFIFLVKYFLESQDEGINPLKIGRAGANFAYWSWFIIGIFGLNATKYGLVGVEAGMLMYTPSIGPKDGLQLMMHADRTWSGPTGWWKITQKVMFLSRRRTASKQDGGGHFPSILWYILLVLSALPLIALPISGLCMEVGDGYIQNTGMTSKKAEVLGRNVENFDSRETTSVLNRAFTGWSMGMPARLPGFGMMYTRPELKRSDYDFLREIPNTFPPDSGIPEIFLTPQAPVPVSGTTWGLVIRYNCSSVSKISELTILNRFHEHGNNTLPKASSENNSYPLSDSVRPIDRTIAEGLVYLRDHRAGRIDNYAAVSEIAMTNAEKLRYDSTFGQEYRAPGLDRDFVFEYVLYQNLDPPRPAHPDAGGTDLFGQSVFDIMDMGIDKSIPEIADRYNTLFDSNKKLNVVVGARCTSSSDVGIADVDGRTLSFSNFKRVDAKAIRNAYSLDVGVKPFGAGAAELVLNTEGDNPSRGKVGLQNIISSVDGRPYIDTHYSFVVPGYIQSKQLRNSLLQCHATYALELMYDGAAKYDDLAQYIKFSNGSSGMSNIKFNSRSFFTHENLTAATPGKILTQGPLKHIWLPLYFLIPWTLVSVILTLMFSPTPRWSDTLDGFSLFRFGADYADEVKGHAEYYSTEDYEKCGPLMDIPGLIGDSRPMSIYGHISLVKDSGTSRDKLYV